MTTAAGLWLITAIGLAVGAGYLLPAFFCTLISLFILYGVRLFKASLPREEHTVLSLKYDRMERPLKQIRKILADYNVSIQFINYKAEIPENLVTYSFRLLSHAEISWGQIITSLSQSKGLKEIHWQEGNVP